MLSKWESMKPMFAGIELGGTKCICILARDPTEIIEQISVATDRPETTLPILEAILDRWHAEVGFSALGLGAFGPLDLDPLSEHFGTVLATPKSGWVNTPLFARFSNRYGVPVGIQTDVAGAALAEGRWGAARGFANHIYVTVGTGIGVGIVVDRQLVPGPLPIEAGHMRVGRVKGDEWPGACRFHGDCVEGLAAGSAIEARLGVRAATLEPDNHIWNLVAHAVGAMLGNLILSVSPQKIVLGGGVINRQPQLIALIRRALVESLGGYVALPDVDGYVVLPALGALAGPLGAIAIAHESFVVPTSAGSQRAMN